MECVVTKLREKINNENIVPLGCIKIHLESSSNTLTVGANSTGVIGKIITPNVTFTNSVFSGLTEQEFPNGSYRTASVSGECDIILSKTTSITRLELGGGGGVAFGKANIDALYGNSAMTMLTIQRASGNIKSLSSMASLLSVFMVSDGIGIYGDIANFPISTSLYSLIINGAINVSGDLSFVSGLSKLVDINIYGASITGDISAFSSLANLRDIDLGRTLVSGSISVFAGKSSLRNLQLIGCDITGNLGQLVNVPALKDATFPSTVYYTSDDAARIDAIMASNGGTQKPNGHYFYGGTEVDSY